MSRRSDLVKIIQDLSEDEGRGQPSAEDWLEDQDEKAKARRERDQPAQAGHDYQDDQGDVAT
ncbi:hypothetical protein QTH90_29620 [Variovorax sp. J2P1-59]|uniref:hypothetical protein n=1 Tax=Variovorax flavidus TaxID=3053501 RepID=UPI002577CD3B|nr:hypothetical protein [Variovorax sp. J2P1-59]MDM0078599.1 hypothetical protein [Variovorax sp. J2P1-59]